LVLCEGISRDRGANALTFQRIASPTQKDNREFRAGKLVNTLEPWAAAVRAVAAKRGVPMLDLNADSAAVVEKLGAVDAMTLAMAPPLPIEVAAAAKGTTLPPRPAEDARLPDVPTTPDGPRGQVARKFDYTHLGPIGAQRISALVAQELARAVPELRSQLLP
jgi:lysophospholipase L1-like esterase